MSSRFLTSSESAPPWAELQGSIGVLVHSAAVLLLSPCQARRKGRGEECRSNACPTAFHDMTKGSLNQADLLTCSLKTPQSKGQHNAADPEHPPREKLQPHLESLASLVAQQYSELLCCVVPCACADQIRILIPIMKSANGIPRYGTGMS